MIMVTGNDNNNNHLLRAYSRLSTLQHVLFPDLTISLFLFNKWQTDTQKHYVPCPESLLLQLNSKRGTNPKIHDLHFHSA